jgi:hypothetical protein
MNFNEFITKYNGKPVDFDGMYSNQCVDLMREYIARVVAQPQGQAGAADFWTAYDKDPVLKLLFDKIPNTPNGIPQPGDIMFWNKNKGGGYGHVAIFISGDVKKFISFDQNWGKPINKNMNDPCKKVTHDYTDILGWLHPKGAK